MKERETVNTSVNPLGVDKKVKEQKEKEKHGKYVRVDEKTLIFVKDGLDPSKVIERYKQKRKQNPYEDD